MNSVRMSKVLRKRDGDYCHYCSIKMVFDGKNGSSSATIEHLKRKADGGGNRSRDLVLACKSCNGIRGTIDAGYIPKYMNIESFRQSLKAKKLHNIEKLIA